MIRFGRKRKERERLNKLASTLSTRLGTRSIIMIGLMGCGKSSVGRRLAARLHLPFADADDEIEAAAGKSISDIFADHGEAEFRSGEQKVIARLLAEGPRVLATGGGAFMNAQTRENITASSISVWLKADLAILMERVKRRSHRPLLQTSDPETVMRKLIDERYPIYAQADIIIESRDVPHETVVNDIIRALVDGPLAAPEGDAG